MPREAGPETPKIASGSGSAAYCETNLILSFRILLTVYCFPFF